MLIKRSSFPVIGGSTKDSYFEEQFPRDRRNKERIIERGNLY